MSTELESEAVMTLDAAGITPSAWALHYFGTEEWHGAECGCPTPECSGSHHLTDEPCLCLPALASFN